MKTLLIGILALGLGTGLFIEAKAQFRSGGQGGGYRLYTINGVPVKWGSPRLGSGADISYWVLTTERNMLAARSCAASQGIAVLFERSQITQDDFEEVLVDAFLMWEDVSDIKFVPAHDAQEADLLIGIQRELEDPGEACIETSRRGEAPVGQIDNAYIHLDPNRIWGKTQNESEPLEDLRVVLAHELGHVLGLAHPENSADNSADNQDVFMAHVNRGMTALTPSDIAGVVYLYGPPTHTGLDQAIAPSDWRTRR